MMEKRCWGGMGIVVMGLFAALHAGAMGATMGAPLDASAAASSTPQTGHIAGHVVDAETMHILAGVGVAIQGTSLEATTDGDGNFEFTNVAVGTYSVRFSYPEVLPLTKTDIIVKSSRTTHLEVEYRLVPAAREEITVSAGYFEESRDQPVSAIGFSSEEIRRAPGSAGDVSRIIFGLPSLGKVDDMMNSLVVRGGSPSENAFFVDNIEVPNINHFPMQGTTGGPIGLLNVDFIEEVSFYSGGFSSVYGDRLSSVMDISYREGNHARHEEKAGLNFAGAQVSAEGPMTSNGSWMLSAQKSYLDLLVDLIGTGAAPRYADAQGKLSISLSDRTKVTVLGLVGIDDYDISQEDAVEDGMDDRVDTQSTEGVVGLNWFQVWGESAYSNTSLSHGFTAYDTEIFRTSDETLSRTNVSSEQHVTLRNVSLVRLGGSHRIRAGAEATWELNDYDLFVAEYTNEMGNVVPASARNVRASESRWSAFAEYGTTILPRLSLNLGLRGDYFSYSDRVHISPRLSLSYALSPRSSVTAAGGLFYQQLPSVLLHRADRFEDLKDPRAYHLVLGFTHLLTPATKLTVEAYDKEYQDMPVDPSLPTMFVFDDLFGWSYTRRTELSDAGRARSRGVELIIQKKLKEKLYGMVSGSWSSSRYKAYDGLWRDRLYDNRYIFSVEGGYKQNQRWEYSMRWIVAGGRPYTPIDVDASAKAGTEILDTGRTNALRMPAYHSLNLRFDRRFYFDRSNLTVFLSVWNAYNRKNVAQYYWNQFERRTDERYQWSIVPVGGLEYEF
ncbi:MAG: TonB-dependent receptor [Acidobacteria bacterium]|nr:TonB-dependent receptor [Acidobacteriota bacterium]